jgi:hypothetical protein
MHFQFTDDASSELYKCRVATESLCFLFAIFSSVNVSRLKIDSPVSSGEQWK